MVLGIITDRNSLNKYSQLACYKEDKQVIRDLIDTAEHVEYMHEKYGAKYKGCAGLAAPQIGHLKRIFVIKMNGVFEPIINPKVLKTYLPIKSMKEECLSRPGAVVKKARHKRIRVKYTDFEGIENELLLSNFLARVFLHELDHLDGILI